MAKSKRSSKDKRMQDNLDAKFKEVYGDVHGTEKITRMNVADAAEEYAKLFGANKNLYRSIASLIDGLKPSSRRILYSWWADLEKCPTNTKPETLNKLKFYRVDKLSSTATASYHPHGGVSLDSMLGRFGQPWSNNVMLIVPQGSYGNMRGDKPAAGRYIMAKLSEYTIDCFFDDFDKYCIPMKPTYDGSTLEPEYLPSKYPNILFNPQFSGIGFGLASNIPSFNVSEVLDATIALLKDPNAKVFLIPDSPTGCDIIDDGRFKNLNKTGVSTIVMRATSTIDYVNNIIKITSLPLDSNSSSVIQSIIKLKNEKKMFDEIVDIKDYTKNGNVYMEIYLKPNAQPEKVLKQLYKKSTGLKSSFPCGLTVIDDYVDYEYNVKDLLLAWIDYRTDTVRSMMLNKLQIIASEKHINEVLLMIFGKGDISDKIDEIVQMSKASKTTDDFINALMKKYKITSIQAKVLAEMRVRQFNKESHQKYLDKRDEIEAEMKEIENIISNDEALNNFIIKQLEDGKKKYGRPRMSKIVKENDKCNDNIPDTEHLIGVSTSGFIKKLKLSQNPNIGPIGKTNSGLTVMQMNNRENLLVIDSEGKLVKISISAIPDMEFTDNGIELKKLFSVKGEIKAVMELPSMDLLKVDDPALGIILITRKGLCKKVPLSEFSKLTDNKPAITLSEGDEVEAAMFDVNKTLTDLIIYTRSGKGTRISKSDIKTMSASAKGSSVIKLPKSEEVIGASFINPKKKLLFCITSSGNAKVIELKYFPVMNKNDDILSIIGLGNGETLLGISSVDKSDIVYIYKKTGEPTQIEIKSLEPTSRASAGEKLIKNTRSDAIVAYKVFTTK